MILEFSPYAFPYILTYELQFGARSQADTVRLAFRKGQ